MTPDYTREELFALYQTLYNSDYVFAGASSLVEYLMVILLNPTAFKDRKHVDLTGELPQTLEEIDCTDNIWEKLIYRSKNDVIPADDTKIRNIFGNEKQIRIATFLKKLLFDVPLKKMPLYIGKFFPVGPVVEWRLKIGK